MPFEPTLPSGEPDLMRASEFQRYLAEWVRPGSQPPAGQAGGWGPSAWSTLSLSMSLDLERHRPAEGALDVLEVLAASRRHAQAVLIHLRHAERVLPLTVFPAPRLVHCPLTMEAFFELPLLHLTVLHVEPAVWRPPGDPERSLVDDPLRYAPLGPVIWALALRGARRTLLDEIGGSAAYRVPAAAQFPGLPAGGSLAAAVERLRERTRSLGEIARWSGLDRERAIRLLNALYLQSGLMVSRAHPAASQGPARS